MPFEFPCQRRRTDEHPTKARAGQIRPRGQLPERNSGWAENLGVCAQHSGAAPKDEAANPNDVKRDRAARTLQKAKLGFAATPREPSEHEVSNVSNGIYPPQSSQVRRPGRRWSNAQSRR